MEGTTIKKPISHVKRIVTNPIPSNQPPPVINKAEKGDNNETASVVSKSLQRASSIYNRNVYSKKSQVRSSVTAQNSSSQSNKQSSSRTEVVRTPVRIKMQTTMKRLTTEANNIPSKPNAFSLPKCPSNLQHSATNTEHLKTQTHTQSKYNRSPYSVRVPASDETKNGQNSSGHFVSSSQAKAASTMGIMNFGTAYSSVVAAANRGCLNTKYVHPHPPPQAVVPKTFPVSGLAGGEVVAGGHTLVHPPPPPGLVALSPQNIGLGLPFRKYYNVDQYSQRRGGSYVVQDPRYGMDHSRISGIYELACKQQSESGFSVCSYYSPSDYINPPTNKIFNETDNTMRHSNSTCSNSRDQVCQNSRDNLCAIDKAMHKSKDSFSPISQQPKKNSAIWNSNGPFSNKLADKSNKNRSRSSDVIKDTPKWENLIEKIPIPIRSQTTDDQFNCKRARQAPKPFPVLKLFSLRHRHAKSLSKCRNKALAISCSTV